MLELAADSVKLLYVRMSKTHHTTIVTKASAAEMKIAARFLDAINVQDHDDFLANYATTIGYRIYLPYKPGTSKIAYISQVMTCAHEHQHVILMEREEPAVYNLLYVTSPATRAIYEGQCYQADLEVYWWYTKAVKGKAALLDLDLENILSNYGCDSKDIKPARVALDKAIKVIKKGGVGCKAAQEAIKYYGWMEAA